MSNNNTNKLKESNNSDSLLLNIADFYVKVLFEETNSNDINLLPSLNAFKTNGNSNDQLLFDLTVKETLPAILYGFTNIGTFNTGNGDIVVDKFNNGSYRYTIKDINNNICCVLYANKDFSKCLCTLNGNTNMKRFGLNNALMMSFAFASCTKSTLLIHASSIKEKEYGYAFIAKSGTGKSTHTGLWLKNIPQCELLNDDNPIIRIINDTPFLYGSPWSGKTPCYRNIRTKLGAITRIERANKNVIEKLKPTEALASILPCCSTMKWDKNIYNAICNNVIKIIEKINVYTLHCLPDKNAATVCHNQISK